MEITASLLTIWVAVLCHFGCASGTPQEITVPNFQSKEELFDIGSSYPYYVVFSYGGGNDGKNCETSLRRAEEPFLALQLKAAGNLEIRNILFAFLNDSSFEKHLQISTCPSIIFYRHGIPILYDGENLNINVDAEDIIIWLSHSMLSHTKVLTDETFEHLTQASTGATTGDWFVWFYRAACNGLAAKWDAVAARLQHSKVVAKVNIDDNPQLAERFNVTSCSAMIFFRQGKLFRYEAKVTDVHALANFADGFYQNVPSEPVKPLPSPFDTLINDLVRWLKTHSSSQWFPVAVGATLVTLLTLVVLTLFVCHSPKGHGANDGKKTQ